MRENICKSYIQFNSIQLSCSVMSDSLWPHGLQHTRLPCPSPTPGASSNSCPLSRWGHPTISPSIVPFSSCLQSFQASGPFLVSQYFASGGQSIGVSASASVLPLNIQGWFLLGLTGLISLLFKGFSGKTMLLFSQSVESDSLWPHGLQHPSLTCPSSTPRVSSNSFPSSQWCHPTISSSVVPFSSCLQSFQYQGLPTSQFFASGGQTTGASASAPVLPMNTQDWFPLWVTGLISLQSKGLSRVFSRTTIRKDPFFGTQCLLWSNSHIHTWLLEKPDLCRQSDVSAF